VRLDLTDLFVFASPESPVKRVLIFDANPFMTASDFHPDAVYRLNVDYDGDTQADVSFSFVFSNRPAAPAPPPTTARLCDVRLITDLTVVEIDDCPHNVGWTQPDEVNSALLAFLRSEAAVTPGAMAAAGDMWACPTRCVVTDHSAVHPNLPSAGMVTAYRLDHDRPHTTVAHHLDPAHRADALRRPEAAGDRALARDGDAGVQGLDYGSHLGAHAATRTGQGDGLRLAAD
jgi:hypothetical protein